MRYSGKKILSINLESIVMKGGDHPPPAFNTPFYYSTIYINETLKTAIKLKK